VTQIPLYQVDAFAEGLFAGNPAAVCPLQTWLDDGLMQRIAAENNLAETAFFVWSEQACPLRWFTPTQEVNLCGHATLASAHVIFNELHPDLQVIEFQTRSGPLTVRRHPSGLEMNFPSRPPGPCVIPADLAVALGQTPISVLGGEDLFVVLASEEQVIGLRPDFRGLKTMPFRGVIATARGRDCDFVSRFFAPAAGIDEDPVTGSAHCALAPYWAGQLNRTSLTGRQLSLRGGVVDCEVLGERVLLRGRCVPYLRGIIEIP
jgi:PhzF family phenazine biosynthesis protein